MARILDALRADHLQGSGSQGGRMQDDERDLEQALEEHRRRIFEAPTEAERKKAERELAEHIARPGLTDDIDQLARAFQIRLKRGVAFPPGTPAEYKAAFAPLLERVAAIPHYDKWEVPAWDLWTQHMVKFSFAYGIEPLIAQLTLKAFAHIAPSPEVFAAATDDADDIERARKTREFVEVIEAAVNEIAQRAIGHFLDALRGRLGSVLDQTLNEIIIKAIDELEAELNNTGEKQATRLRKVAFDEWAKVEKVRLGTPGQGAPALTKEVFEALIDEAQARLRPMNMDQTKTAVVAYINNNYSAVRCGGVKQLNRMLKKFGLDHKFPVENRGQNSE
jgi:hypothetical protein